MKRALVGLGLFVGSFVILTILWNLPAILLSYRGYVKEKTTGIAVVLAPDILVTLSVIALISAGLAFWLSGKFAR